jgi:hypothetical protein
MKALASPICQAKVFRNTLKTLDLRLALQTQGNLKNKRRDFNGLQSTVISSLGALTGSAIANPRKLLSSRIINSKLTPFQVATPKLRGIILGGGFYGEHLTVHGTVFVREEAAVRRILSLDFDLRPSAEATEQTWQLEQVLRIECRSLSCKTVKSTF